MGLFSRIGGLFGKRATLANPDSVIVDWFTDGQTSSGESVSATTAMKFSAVWAAVKRISEDVAQLPLALYERNEDGRRRAENHPLYSILHDLPNDETTRPEFWSHVMQSVLRHGNAIAIKQVDNGGRVRGLVQRKWEDVRKIWRRSDGTLIYTLASSSTSGGTKDYERRQLLVIRGLSTDGVLGLSPIQVAAKEAVGMGLAALKHTARVFGQGAFPGLKYKIPHRMDPEAKRALKKDLKAWYGGKNSHLPIILEPGHEVEDFGRMSMRDAQMIDLLVFSIQDVARIFSIPPHMLGDLSRATFSNIEQQTLAYLVHTLQPWLDVITSAIHRDLLLPGERKRYYAEFVTGALVKVDLKTRYEAYATASINGWINRNEIRQKENMNPIGEVGDIYTTQGANINLESLLRPSTESNGSGRSEKRSTEYRSSDTRLKLRSSHDETMRDAIERIYKRFRTNIGGQAKNHFGQRDAESFLAWLDDYVREQGEYIERVITPVLRSLGLALASEAADQVGGKLPDGIVDLITEFVEAFRKKMQGSVSGGIRKVVEESEPEEIIDNIDRRLDHWVEVNPEKITRATKVKLDGFVTVKTWSLLSVTKTVWRTTNPCPFCDQLDGKVAEIEKQYVLPGGTINDEEGNEITVSKGFMHPPAHTGCECYLEPA